MVLKFSFKYWKSVENGSWNYVGTRSLSVRACFFSHSKRIKSMSENIKQCKLFGEFQNYYGTNNRNVSAKKKQAAHQEVNDSGVAADTLAANIHTFRPTRPQLQLLRWFRFSFTVWQAIRPKRKPTVHQLWRCVDVCCGRWNHTTWSVAVSVWTCTLGAVEAASGFSMPPTAEIELDLAWTSWDVFSDPQGKNAVGYYFIVYVLDLAYGQWYNWRGGQGGAS